MSMKMGIYPFTPSPSHNSTTYLLKRARSYPDSSKMPSKKEERDGAAVTSRTTSSESSTMLFVIPRGSSQSIPCRGDRLCGVGVFCVRSEVGKGRLRRTTENARVNTRRPITGREPPGGQPAFSSSWSDDDSRGSIRSLNERKLMPRSPWGPQLSGTRLDGVRIVSRVSTKIGQLEMRLRRGERRTLRAMLALPTAEAQESSDRLTDRQGPEPAREGLKAPCNSHVE